MGYYDKIGHVGSWKGKDVVIVNGREDVQQDGKIYVIANEKFMMVDNGMVIGILTDSGSVIECKPHPFYFPKKKKSGERGKRREVVEETPVNIEDFSAYTKIVDEFFKNLPNIEYEMIKLEE